MYFTAEEKAYLVHREGLVDKAALTDEFNDNFSCSRTRGSIYQILYKIRSDPVTKQNLAELAKSFGWFTAPSQPSGFTQEHKAFIVYQISHGQTRKNVVTGLDREFSLNRFDHHLQSFLRSLNNESAQALLVEAQMYGWFETAPPPYDSRDFELSTFNWSAEQRAYISILQDRGGILKSTILSRLNSKFNLKCELFDLSRHLHQLSHSGKKAALSALAPKYKWWTPEPKRGEKGYAKLERSIRLENARARRHQQKLAFAILVERNDLNEKEEGNACEWEPQSSHQTTRTSFSSLNSPAGPVPFASAFEDSVLRGSDEEFGDEEEIDEEAVNEEHEGGSSSCASLITLGDIRSANINRTGLGPQDPMFSIPSRTRPDSISEGQASHPVFSRECTSPVPDFLNTSELITLGMTPLQSTNQLEADRGSRARTPSIQTSALHQMSFPPS